MSNPYQSRVQQKRAHCRLMMQWVERHPEAARQEREALLQGLVMHFAIACRLYLREVAHRLAVECPEQIFSVVDLRDARPDGEGLEELMHQDWLPQLFATERQLLNPQPSVSTMTPSALKTAAVNLIAVDSGPAVPVPPDGLECSLLQGWFASFEELVERQRQAYQEY